VLEVQGLFDASLLVCARFLHRTDSCFFFPGRNKKRFIQGAQHAWRPPKEDATMPPTARGGGDGGYGQTVIPPSSRKDTASRLLGLEHSRTKTGNPLKEKPKPRLSVHERGRQERQRETHARAARNSGNDIVSIAEFPELEHLINVSGIPAGASCNALPLATRRACFAQSLLIFFSQKRKETKSKHSPRACYTRPDSYTLHRARGYPRASPHPYVCVWCTVDAMLFPLLVPLKATFLVFFLPKTKEDAKKRSPSSVHAATQPFSPSHPRSHVHRRRRRRQRGSTRSGASARRCARRRGRGGKTARRMGGKGLGTFHSCYFGVGFLGLALFTVVILRSRVWRLRDCQTYCDPRPSQLWDTLYSCNDDYLILRLRRL
jgi:hypothetical protein